LTPTATVRWIVCSGERSVMRQWPSLGRVSFVVAEMRPVGTRNCWQRVAPPGGVRHSLPPTAPTWNVSVSFTVTGLCRAARSGTLIRMRFAHDSVRTRKSDSSRWPNVSVP
jgi:hypothetical protein